MMGKGKIIGTVVAAVAVPAAVVAAAVFILPQFGISASNTLYYFSDGEGSKTVSVGKEDISAYKSRYADAMSDFYFSTLSENDKYIYNATVYAADNGYSTIYLPGSLFTDSEDKMSVVEPALTKLSCDSPFIAHNYTIDGTLSMKRSQYAGNEYYIIELETLGGEYKTRREAAYQTAKSVVSQMPASCDTDAEKAEYIYTYIAENVSYQYDSYSFDNVPIADALIDGKAVCDGYCDTFAMLMNMCGIDTATVNGTNGKEWHAISFSKIDGEYYYFDVTADSSAFAEGFSPAFYFGMSWDITRSYFTFDTKYSSLMPQTAGSIAESVTDCMIDDLSNDSAQQTAQLLSEKSRIMIKFADTITDSEKREYAQNVAKYCGGKIGTAEYNGLVGYRLAA